MRKLLKRIAQTLKDENFMHVIESIEVIVSKVLSIFLVLVILVVIVDLGFFLARELFIPNHGSFNSKLLNIFGLFLEVLIALEILENIT
ncbi:MAG: phosphate-starvation-inducible PsiE family protein, partial [Rhizonema sp. PD38]|nr:phosphate-starvation-inducible PsiE family protein [Rhizonema sp. PD38]